MTAARSSIAVVSRRVAALALLLAAILLAAGAAPARAAAAPAEPAGISARSAIVVETTTGAVLYRRQVDTPRAIASTTKLMTALLVLERSKLSTPVTAGPNRTSAIESRINLRAGERLTVADLLRALLLPSANDAAMTLAEHVGGTQARFVRLMNARARQLGLSETHYANPIGLDAPGNRSSARDLVTLTLKLRTFEFFRRTVARSYVQIESGDHLRTLRNRNQLVRRRDVDGVKTGHTSRAGYVLVASGRRGGVRLISVVLGTPSEAARDGDTLDLLRYGFARVQRRTLVREGAVLARVPIRYRRGARLDLMTDRTVRHVVRRGDKTPPDIAVSVPDAVAGPIAAGQVVGTATIALHGEQVATVRLLSRGAVPAAGLGQRAKERATEPLPLIAALAALAAAAALGGLALRRREGRASRRPPRDEATEPA